MDPFTVLGIARAYPIDLPAVEKRHRELSRALHPDKFVGAGASERRAALAKAIEVNEAWRIVRDPIRRAEALLNLAGVATGDDARTSASPELLMEMLEKRESLTEAKQARDAAAVRALAASMEERARSVEQALADGFARGEGAALREKLGELRFCRRFLDEVTSIEEEWAA